MIFIQRYNINKGVNNYDSKNDSGRYGWDISR